MTAFLLSARIDLVLPFSFRFLSQLFSAMIESAFLIRLLRSVFLEPARAIANRYCREYILIML